MGQSVPPHRSPAKETMSADPHTAPRTLPRMIVRGALALELVPGSQPGRAALRQAEAGGFKSAVEWRDSGRPIPEGDEARALVRDLERQLAAARSAQI